MRTLTHQHAETQPDEEEKTAIPERLYWHGELSGDDYHHDEVNNLVDTEADANLISSLTSTGMHAPALDIDHEAYLRKHRDDDGGSLLYVDLRGTQGITAEPYTALILVLGDTGIISQAEAGQQCLQIAHRNADDRKWGSSVLHIPLACPARLIPSATTDHYHLYLDVEMAWVDYKRLLKAAAGIGLIEPGYCHASLHRGMSHLRWPADSKTTP